MTKTKAKILLIIMAVLLIFGIIFAFVGVDTGPATSYKPYPAAIKLGLDLKGGIYAVYHASQSEGAEKTQEQFDAAIVGTADSLEQLLFSKGYTEAVVSYSGNEIRVEVPDVDDPESVFELIGKPAVLEFKATDDGDPILTGSEHLDAVGITNAESGTGYALSLQFNAEGTKIFAEHTKANVQKTFGIWINGSKIMEPTINEEIPNGQAIISPSGGQGYEYQEAYDMAVQLQAGCFPLELEIIEYDNITEELGGNAITTALIAGGIGFLLIALVMMWWYRALGFAAVISLGWYTITFLFFMAIFPWVQLTLSGIAGILLSIGMAVDANVIIFERIKEERKLNKPIVSSVNIGFKKSLSAIIDGNVTTLLGAIVMWIFGSSTIKGFAITLFIGIILSMLFSLVVTRVIIKCFLPFNNSSDKLYGLKTGDLPARKSKASVEGGAS